MPEGEVLAERRRRYSSAGRTRQARLTRLRIIQSAHGLFVERGYAATTVRDVARRAGVSVATVELGFRAKRQLLKVAVDVAIAGDDEPVPVLQRAWAQAARHSPTTDDFLAAIGAALARAQERAAGLIAAAYEAARHDPEIDDLVRTLERGRTGTAEWIVDRLAERGPRRWGLDRADAVDVVWVLIDPVVFLRLTARRGWTTGRYETWIRDSIPRLLTDPHSAHRAGDPR